MIEPSSIDLLIYHKDCTDGFGAAYAAWKLLGNRAEYHASKHGNPPPDVNGNPETASLRSPTSNERR